MAAAQVHQRGFPGRQLDDQVGCAAELRQLKRQADGSAYVIVKGRQRVLRLRDGKPATQPWDARVRKARQDVFA